MRTEALAAILLLFVLESSAVVYGFLQHSLISFSFFSSQRTSRIRRHGHPHVPSYKGSPSHTASGPSTNAALAPSGSQFKQHGKQWGPIPGPALPPTFRGHAPMPGSRRRHQDPRIPQAQSPYSISPTSSPDCAEVICSDPLTSTPLGSPCGCVLPMQVELDLGVAPFRVFTVIPELEIEVAAGTYVKQSQVRIMAAVSSNLDDDKTRVDIDLVPLGEKFDSMTAFLIFERFWQKKVPINASIFGEYEVIYVNYPGLPASPPSGIAADSPGASQLPFTARVPSGRSRKLNARIISSIALSSIVLVLVCIGSVYIISRWRNIRRSSMSARVAFSSSIIKQTGIRSMMSSSIESSNSVSLVSTMAACPSSVKTFTFAELESATDNFSSRKVLGEGGFGRVYHGIMENGMEAAIKLLTHENQNGDREFIAEVEMLSRLHHRNLVKLIGICVEGCTRCLVYELIRNGSVESHLHGVDRDKCPLDWDTRMKIALGSARGLAYLHEDSNPRVIHRDFKASNVLLEDDFTPKVADFGLAREASEGSHHISTRVMGTFGYVAPEYAMTGHLLVKSDVYSYGVVLLELLSGRKPVDMSQPQGQENLVTWARPLLTSREGLERLADPTLNGNYNFDNMAKVAAIASMCVQAEVSDRPFMGEVVQALKLLCNDMNETCEDCYSQRESSVPDCDYRGETGTGSSWWNAGTPRLTFGYASSFITMEYSSGPMDEFERPRSVSMAGLNRSGPLRTSRHTRAFARLRGSISDHWFLSGRLASQSYWF